MWEIAGRRRSREGEVVMYSHPFVVCLDDISFLSLIINVFFLFFNSHAHITWKITFKIQIYCSFVCARSARHLRDIGYYYTKTAKSYTQTKPSFLYMLNSEKLRAVRTLQYVEKDEWLYEITILRKILKLLNIALAPITFYNAQFAIQSQRERGMYTE